mgnify:CR=1 FL=1
MNYYNEISQGYEELYKEEQIKKLNFIKLFLEKLNIKKPHLIGHSRGGYIVTRLALEYPEIAKSIVIIDSATLMQDIRFYHDLADRVPSFNNEHEKIKYMIKENSWGNKHITDEWIEGNIEYSNSQKNIIAQYNIGLMNSTTTVLFVLLYSLASFLRIEIRYVINASNE